jgi:predicted transcriptional regulator
MKDTNLKTGQILENIEQAPARRREDALLPRRREIYLVIKDHHEVSFDFIRRRFMIVPVSTLHYDLSQLMKQGLIEKIGVTKGALYRILDYR